MQVWDSHEAGREPGPIRCLIAAFLSLMLDSMFNEGAWPVQGNLNHPSPNQLLRVDRWRVAIQEMLPWRFPLALRLEWFHWLATAQPQWSQASTQEMNTSSSIQAQHNVQDFYHADPRRLRSCVYLSSPGGCRADALFASVACADHQKA